MNSSNRNEKYIFAAVMLAVITAAALICIRLGSTRIHTEDESKVRVVASFYPMYIAAMNVADGVEDIGVECLTQPQTGCLHDYQLTPQDLITLSGADLFVINGGGIESFLGTVADQYPDLTIVDTSVGFAEEQEDSDHADHAEHEHSGENAHYWMSVSYYEEQVNAIANAMAAAKPESAGQILANRDRYIRKLEELRLQMQEVTGMQAGEKVVSFHEAFEFFADEIGAECAYSIDMDENTSLSAGEIADLIRTVKEDGISLVFAEEKYGTRIADAISAETDAKVCILDSLVSGDGTPDSYIKGMEENLRLVREARTMKGGEQR